MKTVFLTTVLMFTILNVSLNGQGLIPKIGSNGKWGLVDKAGNVVIPSKYDNSPWFWNGMAAVKLDGKWGYIDKNGKEVIPLEYDNTVFFSGGLVAVCINDMWGMVYKNGTLIIPHKYTSAIEAHERVAIEGAEQLAKAKQIEKEEAKRLAVIKAEVERKETERLAATKIQTTNTVNQNITTTNLNVVKSDVAINIPITDIKNDKTLALIIANEDYHYAAPVEFAKNDGDIFRQYCIQTLGIPEKNIKYLTNATLRNIRREIQLTCQIAETYNGAANIIFYYAGHGVPDQRSEVAYLLPVDGEGNDLEASGYKLDELYREFGKTDAQKIVVILDACFSGAQRGGEMLASARGVKIKPKPFAPSGNTVVFSATYADESAYPYKEQGHGLFTYFILKKLQESKGNVTLGELYEYVSQNVRREALRVNRNNQTPTVTPSVIMESDWKNKKLK